MINKSDKLIALFREHGGLFENMTIGYSPESGYGCSVIDNQREATVFCPSHLLVDIDDIGINENGLFIARPEKYTDNIRFLTAYFSFHFNKKSVARVLQEKDGIDSMSEQEIILLKKIGLPDIVDGLDERLAYARYRILDSHLFRSTLSGKNVIMPFISFLNHSPDGVPINFREDGVTVSGRFNGEIFINYNMGDVLMFLGAYGFVTTTDFTYSLPMWLKSPDGVKLKIERNASKFELIDDKFRWPVVEKENNLITASWFPIYYKYGPGYPGRFAATLAHELNVPAQDILHSIFLYNLNALLPVAFSLRDSKNSYVQMVVSGVQRQLEQIGKVEK